MVRKGGGDRKRQTTSTARFWKGITTDQYWERGRHEPGGGPLGPEAASRPRHVVRGGATAERTKLVGKEEGAREEIQPVSYTHLTLPTICSV